MTEMPLSSNVCGEHTYVSLLFAMCYMVLMYILGYHSVVEHSVLMLNSEE